MVEPPPPSLVRLHYPKIPRGGQTPLNWILLDVHGYIAECPNAAFAHGTTSFGERIEVSFCMARPPHVSYLCVHCPGLGPADFGLAPRVISAEADLILLCVSTSHSALFYRRYCDYFLYRAHPRNPSLDLLPNPYPNRFDDHEEFALLSLSSGEYAVAVLTGRSRCNKMEFDLYLYRSSEAQLGWTSKVFSWADPQLRNKLCPVDCGPYHETTKVITLECGL